MRNVKHAGYGSFWKSVVGVVCGALAILTVFIGFAPAEATSPSATDNTNPAVECPPYFAPEYEEGTTFLIVRPDGCFSPVFVRSCGGRLFVVEELLGADDDDLCSPEMWPAFSCSLSLVAEPTFVPDDFCDPAAWPADSCGIIIHLVDENEMLAPCNGDLEAYRQYAVDEMTLALESYWVERGTYEVPDAGPKGTGEGWAFYEGGPRDVTSIASRLRDGGHLSSVPVHDPLWTGSTSVVGDVFVYRCKDRVAVFTREGDGRPTAEDRAWWDDKGCPRYPIKGLKAKYFKLSRDFDPEVFRVSAVNQMVLALESYGAENGTYGVADAGSKGTGEGWAFYEGGPKYVTSIASVLQEGGHFEIEPLHDPLWTGSTSVVGDVFVYRCKDRVAVFTREGDGQPTVEDRAWWGDNGCSRYPTNGLKAMYFKLSQSIDQL